MRQEFMKRWIQKTDSHRQVLHGLENTYKILSLYWQEFGQGFHPSFFLFRKDHLTHGLDPVC